MKNPFKTPEQHKTDGNPSNTHHHSQKLKQHTPNTQHTHQKQTKHTNTSKINSNYQKIK